MSAVVTTGSARKDLPPGCMALFGLPFLAVGIGVTAMAIWTLITYHRSARWDTVDARIQRCELEEHRGSKGGRTWKLSGSYTYTVHGRDYTGDRFVLESGANSDRAYWQELYDIAERHRQSGQPLPILVDPARPERSLVFRRLSSMALVMPLFGLLFGAVGVGVVGWGLIGTFRSFRQGQAARQFPQKPWRAEGRWQNFSVQSGNLSAALGALAFAGFFTVFISMFVMLLRSDPHAPLIAKGIIGLFALVAVMTVGWALYLLLQYLKYGRATLLLAQVPFVPGGEFAAILLVQRHIEASEGCRVTLRCLEKTETGSGKQRRTHTETLHEQVEVVKRDLSRPGEARSAIPIRMRIPAGLPSRRPDANPRIEWSLEVTAETPGIDFAATFDVPVYVADKSLIEYRLDGLGFSAPAERTGAPAAD